MCAIFCLLSILSPCLLPWGKGSLYIPVCNDRVLTSTCTLFGLISFFSPCILPPWEGVPYVAVPYDRIKTCESAMFYCQRFFLSSGKYYLFFMSFMIIFELPLYSVCFLYLLHAFIFFLEKGSPCIAVLYEDFLHIFMFIMMTLFCLLLLLYVSHFQGKVLHILLSSTIVFELPCLLYSVCF